MAAGGACGTISASASLAPAPPLPPAPPCALFLFVFLLLAEFEFEFELLLVAEPPCERLRLLFELLELPEPTTLPPRAEFELLLLEFPDPVTFPPAPPDAVTLVLLLPPAPPAELFSLLELTDTGPLVRLPPLTLPWFIVVLVLICVLPR